MTSVLSGPALLAAQALARGYGDDHEILVYLGPLRGALDEATITTAWVPGGGWVDRTSDVLLSAGLTLKVTERGASLTLTLADEDRTIWADDRAVAVVARHWLAATGWGPWYMECQLYLDGSGQATFAPDTGQTGRRNATYSGYWQRLRLPAHRLGRRNLATGASIHASSPMLMTPASEAGNEYIYADDVGADKIIDGLVDSVSIADVFATAAPSATGQTEVPKFLRVGGPFTRGVAAGGHARYAELWAGHEILGWGSFSSPGSVPAPEGNASTTISNDLLDASITAGKYVIHCKAQPQNQSNSVYVQWNVGSAYLGLPAILAFKVKAGSSPSIGREMVLQWGHSGTNHNVPLTLSGDWQTFEVPIDALATTGSVAGGLTFRFRADRAELMQSDLYFELDDIELWLGYDGAWYTKREGKALFLACDDGAGHQKLIRLANVNGGGDELNGGNEIVIPPRGSVIIVDDKATFEQEYGKTGQTILQLKSVYPEWFFAPGVGRMKLVWGNDPLRTNYSAASLSGAVTENGTPLAIEEIDFAVANGGVPWLPHQALSRQSPIGTGYLALEEFPHTGLLPLTGAAYWWVDLGAYAAPTLTAPLPVSGFGSDLIHVSDLDQYTEQGFGTALLERIWWSGKTEDALVVHQRGYGGTTAVAHVAGESFIPDKYGGTWQSLGLPQTGHTIDQIELRRKQGTSLIMAGAVLVSNLVAPGDPSVGGARWERHPDWRLIQRFNDRQGNPDVITMNLIDILGGPVEARHIVVVIDRMAFVNGLPSRAKLNELIVREWTAGGNAGGSWRGHAVADLGGALAHVVVMHALVPATKVAVVGRMPAIGDLTVAPSMVDAALDSLSKNDGVRIRVDRANAVTIEPTPLNPAYSATVPYWVWTADLVVDTLEGGWELPRRVAQVRVNARDVASYRQYNAQYPRIAGALGAISDLKDVRVLTPDGGFQRAVLEYRAGNVRRTALTLKTGAVPWLEVGQRHLLNLTDLDAGGGFASVNVAVKGYTITTATDDGGVTWQTDVDVEELSLG